MDQLLSLNEMTNNPTQIFQTSSVSYVDDALTTAKFDRITLPFNFPFFDGEVDYLYLSPNGAIHFNSDPPCCDYFYFLDPDNEIRRRLACFVFIGGCNYNTTNYRNLIAGVATDLNPGADSTAYIRYQITDNDVTVKYENVPLYISPSYTGDAYNKRYYFSMTLYSSGSICIRYDTIYDPRYIGGWGSSIRSWFTGLRALSTLAEYAIGNDGIINNNREEWYTTQNGIYPFYDHVKSGNTLFYHPYPTSICIFPSMATYQQTLRIVHNLQNITAYYNTDVKLLSFYCVFSYLQDIHEIYGYYNESTFTIDCQIPSLLHINETYQIKLRAKYNATNEVIYSVPFNDDKTFIYLSHNDSRINDIELALQKEDICHQCKNFNILNNYCYFDCNNDWRGKAIIDDCNVCVGGNTGKLLNSSHDCSNICLGPHVVSNNLCVCPNINNHTCDTIIQIPNNPKICARPNKILTNTQQSIKLTIKSTEWNIIDAQLHLVNEAQRHEHNWFCRIGSQIDDSNNIHINATYNNNTLTCITPKFNQSNIAIRITIGVDTNITFNLLHTYISVYPKVATKNDTWYDDWYEAINFDSNLLIEANMTCRDCSDLYDDYCYQDCYDTWRGSAIVDECDSCVNGLTGKEWNYLLDCNNVCNGHFEVNDNHCKCDSSNDIGTKNSPCFDYTGTLNSSILPTVTSSDYCATPRWIGPSTTTISILMKNNTILASNNQTNNIYQCLLANQTILNATIGQSINGKFHIICHIENQIFSWWHTNETIHINIIKNQILYTTNLYVSYVNFDITYIRPTKDIELCDDCKYLLDSSYCWKDCGNFYRGDAILDDCNECTGGLTNLPINNAKDCDGYCFGPSIIDNNICTCNAKEDVGNDMSSCINESGLIPGIVPNNLSKLFCIHPRYASYNYNKNITISITSFINTTIDTCRIGGYINGYYDVAATYIHENRWQCELSNQYISINGSLRILLLANHTIIDHVGHYFTMLETNNSIELNKIDSYCNDCSFINTTYCWQDCFNVFRGKAYLDDCNVCSEGKSNHIANSDKDCMGECFGTSVNRSDLCVCQSDENLGINNNSSCFDRSGSIPGNKSFLVDQTWCIHPRYGKSNINITIMHNDSYLLSNVKYCLFGGVLNYQKQVEIIKDNDDYYCLVPNVNEIDNNIVIAVYLQYENNTIATNRPQYYSLNHLFVANNSLETFCNDCSAIFPDTCIEDCTHTWSGDAYFDVCNECVGGTSGKVAEYTKDCDDVCGGQLEVKDNLCGCYSNDNNCMLNIGEAYGNMANQSEFCLTPKFRYAGSMENITIYTKSLLFNNTEANIECLFGGRKLGSYTSKAIIISSNRIQCSPPIAPSYYQVLPLRLRYMTTKEMIKFSRDLYVITLPDLKVEDEIDRATIKCLDCIEFLNKSIDCWMDCHQTYKGHAMIDSCGECVAGRTSKVANESMDCEGICFGPFTLLNGLCACVDTVENRLGTIDSPCYNYTGLLSSSSTNVVVTNSSICVSDLFGPAITPIIRQRKLYIFNVSKEWSMVDKCFFGGKLQGNIETLINIDNGELSCDIPNGTSGTAIPFNIGNIYSNYYFYLHENDNRLSNLPFSLGQKACEKCVNYENNTCHVDCAGVMKGSAIIDDCNTCTGGNTSIEYNINTDCAGVCDGPFVEEFLDTFLSICYCEEEENICLEAALNKSQQIPLDSELVSYSSIVEFQNNDIDFPPIPNNVVNITKNVTRIYLPFVFKYFGIPYRAIYLSSYGSIFFEHETSLTTLIGAWYFAPISTTIMNDVYYTYQIFITNENTLNIIGKGDTGDFKLQLHSSGLITLEIISIKVLGGFVGLKAEGINKNENYEFRIDNIQSGSKRKFCSVSKLVCLSPTYVREQGGDSIYLSVHDTSCLIALGTNTPVYCNFGEDSQTEATYVETVDMFICNVPGGKKDIRVLVWLSTIDNTWSSGKVILEYLDNIDPRVATITIRNSDRTRAALCKHCSNVMNEDVCKEDCSGVKGGFTVPNLCGDCFDNNDAKPDCLGICYGPFYIINDNQCVCDGSNPSCQAMFAGMNLLPYSHTIDITVYHRLVFTILCIFVTFYWYSPHLKKYCTLPHICISSSSSSGAAAAAANNDDYDPRIPDVQPPPPPIITHPYAHRENNEVMDHPQLYMDDNPLEMIHATSSQLHLQHNNEEKREPLQSHHNVEDEKVNSILTSHITSSQANLNMNNNTHHHHHQNHVNNNNHNNNHNRIEDDIEISLNYSSSDESNSTDS